MSNYVQLIDTDYIFSHTTIDKNVDADILGPSIIVAQDTSIQQIIGYNLLQTIMDMVANNVIDNPVNINYKTLLNNYIQPSLAHHSVWYALPEIQYRLTNKSILSKTTDNAQTTGLAELKYLRDNAKHIAEFYNQRIREQIINNPQLYPEYFQTVGIDRIVPKRSTYFSGWSSSGSPNRRKGDSGFSDPDCANCGEPGINILNW